MPLSQKIGRAAPLADQVFASLQAEILEGRLQPGERLPTEPALSAGFEVSRTVIREAISRLRNDGLVVTKQGAGVFVAAVALDRTFRLPGPLLEDATALREIFELRLGVEVEAAALAAKRRVPEDAQRMARALAQIEATKTGPDCGVAADVEFHRAIAMASKNSKLASFQRYLSVFFIQSVTAARTHTLKNQPGLAAEVTAEHEAIFEAINAKKPDAAREAMRAHLLAAQSRLGLLEAPDFLQNMRRLR
jgi:DNA-binding FadR family transcriptional regulator